MSRVTVEVFEQEKLTSTISKGTPLGLLATKALVWLGSTGIEGGPAAVRRLAQALQDAADLAEAYDADPEGFNRREKAQREGGEGE